MSPKDQFIAAVRNADISDEDWMEECLPYLASLPFARGYLARLQDELGAQLDTRTEDYRKAILETEEYVIWQ